MTSTLSTPSLFKPSMDISISSAEGSYLTLPVIEKKDSKTKKALKWITRKAKEHHESVNYAYQAYYAPQTLQRESRKELK